MTVPQQSSRSFQNNIDSELEFADKLAELAEIQHDIRKFKEKESTNRLDYAFSSLHKKLYLYTTTKLFVDARDIHKQTLAALLRSQRSLRGKGSFLEVYRFEFEVYSQRAESDRNKLLHRGRPYWMRVLDRMLDLKSMSEKTFLKKMFCFNVLLASICTVLYLYIADSFTVGSLTRLQMNIATLLAFLTSVMVSCIVWYYYRTGHKIVISDCASTRSDSLKLFHQYASAYGLRYQLMFDSVGGDMKVQQCVVLLKLK